MSDVRTTSKIPVAGKNGRRMWLRPIRPDDATALQRAFARMDLRDRRARLFAPISELTDQAAQRFCTIDETCELCLVLESDDEPGEILGGCRLMGDRPGDTAEFAVSLRSDIKGQGLGHALLETLLDRATQMGFQRVWASILSDNTAMRALAEDFGFHITRDPDDLALVKAELAISRP